MTPNTSKPIFTTERKPLVETEVAPVEARLVSDDILFVDFGRAAFGTVSIPSMKGAGRNSVVVHLGEKLAKSGRIDRNPPGSVSYIRIEQELERRQSASRILIPPDKRNTGLAAIKMPSHIGEVTPFRYAEIEDAGKIEPSAIRQICVHYPFNECASSFDSSDPVLNAIWDLCKYSIKATSFCGVYVDGDRERIP
jgi:hypothetical protein